MTDSQPPVFSPCAHYFEPIVRTQLREKIAHMVRFSDFILTLTGVAGVGKSQFSAQLANSLLHPEHQVCFIAGDRAGDINELVTVILEQLPEQLSPTDMHSPIEVLSEIISVLRNRGVRLLLVIDDADEMADDALSLLVELQLFHDHSDGLCPQILFVGLPAFGERLLKQAEEEGFSERCFHVELEPLKSDEVKLYLESRFGERGQVKAKTLQKLFKKTQGNFAQLEAHFTKQTVHTSSKAFPFPMIHMIGLAISLAGVLGVSVWYFVPEQELIAVQEASDGLAVSLPLSPPAELPVEVPQLDGQPTLSDRFASKNQDSSIGAMDDSESLPVAPNILEPIADEALESEGVGDDGGAVAKVETELSKNQPVESVQVVQVAPVEVELVSVKQGQQLLDEDTQEPIAEPDPVALTPVALPDKAEVLPVVLSEEAASKGVAETVPADSAATSIKVVETVQVGEKVSAEPVDASVDVVEPVAEVQESAPQAKVSVEKEPVVVIKTPIRQNLTPDQVSERMRSDEARLLQKTPDGYVLQLLGARNRNSMETFIEQWGTIDDLYAFETMYKDKPFFVVIYGLYPSRTLAKSGISELPQPVQALRPWARSLRGVQADVRKRE